MSVRNTIFQTMIQIFQSKLTLTDRLTLALHSHAADKSKKWLNSHSRPLDKRQSSSRLVELVDKSQ